MSETKHTPGPWAVDDRRNRSRGWIDIMAKDEKGRFPVAYTVGVADRPEDERLADARLIASAPDLLAACEALEDRDCEVYGEGRTCPPNEYPTRCPVCLARTAIAKAKGGTE